MRTFHQMRVDSVDHGPSSKVLRPHPACPGATSHALALLAVLLVAITVAAAEEGWRCVNPTAGQAALCACLHDVHSDGSQIVAVGEQGKLMVSADGSSWEDRDTPAEEDLWGVNGNGVLWVAVGKAGTILTSADGNVWTARDSGTTRDLFDVTWADSLGLFVAVGGSQYSAEIHTSPDGVTWTRSTAASSYRLRGVACNPTRCAAVGSAGAIQWSDDALSWTLTPPYALAANISRVTTNGTLFVAVGGGSVYNDPYILSSPDGQVWTQEENGNKSLYDVCWGGIQFVAVGSSGVMTSPNGSDWTQQSTGSSRWLYGVGFDGTSYVAVGEVALLTSADGSSWTDRLSGNVSTSTYKGLNAVVLTGSHFTAVGYAGLFLTSQDGQSWVEHTTFTGSELFGVTAGTGAQVAYAVVTKSGMVYTSDDLVSWTGRGTGTTQDLLAIANSGSRFVAVGAGGAIQTSELGHVWTTAASPATSDLNGLVRTGSSFVVVGDDGTVLTSADGTSWTAQDSGSTLDLYDVVWDGTQLIASAESGNAAVSADGTTWVFSTIDQDLPHNTLFGIHATQTWAVTAGGNSALLASNQAGAAIWEQHDPRTRYLTFSAVGGNAACFLVAGEGGAILSWFPPIFTDGFESGDTSAWSLATQ